MIDYQLNDPARAGDSYGWAAGMGRDIAHDPHEAFVAWLNDTDEAAADEVYADYHAARALFVAAWCKANRLAAS